VPDDTSRFDPPSVEELIAKLRGAMRTSPTIPEMRAVSESSPPEEKSYINASINMILATRQYLWLLVHIAEAQSRDHFDQSQVTDGRLDRIEKGLTKVQGIVDKRLDQLENEIGELKELMLNVSTLIGASINGGKEPRNDNAAQRSGAPEPEAKSK
jgi:hypothetical protein